MSGNDPPLRKLGIYLGLIYTFPTTILLPALAGWWLDGKLHTAPWLLILGFFLGLAAGFTYLFKTLSVIGRGKGR